MTKTFEIRAFLPSTLSSSQGSPLFGVDSLFFRVKALTSEEAYTKFIDNPHLVVELPEATKEGQAIFIRPKSCPAAYVSEIVEATQEEDKAQLPRKVHLRRVK